MEIPPVLWATDGLAVITGKLPLSLPSPRALDPAGLEVARGHIAFAKVYELPSESLQKCDANLRVPFFVWASGTKTIQNAVRGVTRENQAHTDLTFLLNYFLPLLSSLLPIIVPTYTRDTFETIEVLGKIQAVMKRPKALPCFLEFRSMRK